MSERTNTPTEGYDRKRLSDRQVSLPAASVAALVTAVLSGGLGSGLTGSSVSAELREFRVEVKGQLDALRSDMARQASDHRDSMARVEILRGQIDELRIWRAKVEAREDRGGGPR